MSDAGVDRRYASFVARGEALRSDPAAVDPEHEPCVVFMVSNGTPSSANQRVRVALADMTGDEAHALLSALAATHHARTGPMQPGRYDDTHYGVRVGNKDYWLSQSAPPLGDARPLRDAVARRFQHEIRQGFVRL